MAIKCPACHSENPETSRFCAGCGTQLPLTKGHPPVVTETLETSVHELATGSTFAGRYQVIEELGHGGMGKVYKVFDQEVRAKLALKVIKPEIAADRNVIDRFRNELKTARDISHKNICRMYDLGREQGNYFITMEYVSGEDLKSFIRRSHQLVVGTAMVIARQVCDGLAEAHRAGVIHRDLKPGNIMIDREGNAKIMDFGIARSVEAKGITGAGVMIGTPEYMSPEQVESKEVDARSDIYALGIILYEMLTGQVPFEGDTPFTVGVKQKSEIPKDPRGLNAQISPDLSRLILKCLEKDKARRYQSAVELGADLQRIEQGLPTTQRVLPKSRPVTSREITVKFRPRRLIFPVLSVLAVAILIFIVLKFIPKRHAALAPKIENSVAVINFENQTGDKSYDYLQKAIPNLLITNLEQGGNLYVATWERLHDLLRQAKKDNVDFITADLGCELCRMEGIKTIVLGSFTKAGDVFVTDVKLLDAETKRLLKSASSRGEGVDSILRTQIDELSGVVSKGIGVSVQAASGGPSPVAEVTTRSMEAYKYFIRANEKFFEEYYNEEARDLYKKAVEIDPSFAAAYQYLAWAHIALGEMRAGREAIEKAMTYARNATEKERLYIEADYANIVKSDQKSSIQLLEQLISKYPKEKMAYFTLATEYEFLEPDKAIEQLNKALALDPGYVRAVSLLGVVYRFKGDFGKALEVFQKEASLAPGNPNPLDSIANLYFREGRVDEAAAKFQEALSLRPDFYQSMFGLSYIAAIRQDYSEADRWLDKIMAVAKEGRRGELDGHMSKGFLAAWLGRLNNASSELRKFAEIADSLGNEGMKGFAAEIMAWAYYEQEKLEPCRESFKTAEESFAKAGWNRYINYFNQGLLDLKQGRIASARSRIAEMASLLTAAEAAKDYGYNLLSSEALLAEGKAVEAISLLEKAPASFLQSLADSYSAVFHNFPFLKDALARAYERNGQIDKAIAEYERLTRFDPGRTERFLIHPKYHYLLAKLYEKKGLKAKAVERSQRFLDLWKDADPGTPEVTDAKARLAGLQRN